MPGSMPPLRRIFFIVAIIVVFAILFSYYVFEIKKILQFNSAIVEREAERNEQRELVKSYKEKVSFYKTKEGIEHLAREQYNLVAPGARVFLLISPDEQ